MAFLSVFPSSSGVIFLFPAMKASGQNEKTVAFEKKSSGLPYPAAIFQNFRPDLFDRFQGVEKCFTEPSPIAEPDPGDRARNGAGSGILVVLRGGDTDCDYSVPDLPVGVPVDQIYGMKLFFRHFRREFQFQSFSCRQCQPEKETVRVLPGFLCGEMSPALFVAAEKTDRLRRVAWKVGFDDLKIMGKRAGFLNAEASVRTGQHRGGNGGHGKTPED